MSAIGRELRYFFIYRTYSFTVPDQTSERGELTLNGRSKTKTVRPAGLSLNRVKDIAPGRLHEGS